MTAYGEHLTAAVNFELPADAPFDENVVALYLVHRAMPHLLDPGSRRRPAQPATLAGIVASLNRWSAAEGHRGLQNNELLRAVIAGARVKILERATVQARSFTISDLRRVVGHPPHPTKQAIQCRAIAVLLQLGLGERDLAHAGRASDDSQQVTLTYPAGVVTLPHVCHAHAGNRCDACILVEADSLQDDGKGRFLEQLYEDDRPRRNATRPREVRLIIERLRARAGLSAADLTEIDDVDRWRLLVMADPRLVAWMQLAAYATLGLLSGLRHDSIKKLVLGVDLRVVSAGLEIRLTTSKGDQQHKRLSIDIPRSGDAICAYHHVSMWVALARIGPGERVFRRVVNGRVHPNRPFTNSIARAALRLALLQADVDPSGYSTRSLRHGFAYEARALARTEPQIAKSLGHAKLSTTAVYGRSRNARRADGRR